MGMAVAIFGARKDGMFDSEVKWCGGYGTKGAGIVDNS